MLPQANQYIQDRQEMHKDCGFGFIFYNWRAKRQFWLITTLDLVFVGLATLPICNNNIVPTKLIAGT